MKALLALGLGFVSAGAVAVAASGPESAPSACVKLVHSEPFPPDEAPMPPYPDDAKSAHIEGDVSFHFEVVSGCATEDVTIDDGPEKLRDPVSEAVKKWRYCGVPEGQEIHAMVSFRLNCPAKPTSLALLESALKISDF